MENTNNKNNKDDNSGSYIVVLIVAIIVLAIVVLAVAKFIGWTLEGGWEWLAGVVGVILIAAHMNNH